MKKKGSREKKLEFLMKVSVFCITSSLNVCKFITLCVQFITEVLVSLGALRPKANDSACIMSVAEFHGEKQKVGEAVLAGI